MKAAFESILTRTKQERQDLIKELKRMYVGTLKESNNAWNEHRKDKKSGKKRAAYFETIQRVGAFDDIFRVLELESEMCLNEFDTISLLESELNKA